MNQRYRRSYAYSEPRSIFSGFLGWAILLGFAGLVVLAIMGVLNGSRKSSVIMDSGDWGKAINAEINGLINPATGLALRFPAISQRDQSQYTSEAEWREWSPSACSAAAIASVLNGYGKNVKVSEVLQLERDQGAISSRNGLFSYGVFSSIARKYGLRADYSESKDLNRHFDTIMAALGKGYPVIVNVQDANAFPNGHFVVAVRVDGDSVSIINPDPERGKPVLQQWSKDSLKTYFSRSLRSAIYMSA